MADDAARIAQLEAELGQARRQIESMAVSLSESEAREQTLAEIARITAASPSDAQPLLDAVVESGDGQGSTFTVRLPISVQPSPPVSD